MNAPDIVRECLEKDVRERTDDDIDVILNAVQHLKVSFRAASQLHVTIGETDRLRSYMVSQKCLYFVTLNFYIHQPISPIIFSRNVSE